MLTLRLATVRDDGEPTRRRAAAASFSRRVAARYRAGRLPQPPSGHGHHHGGETHAEVAHEAIFRRWDKLRDWIAAEREFLIWRSGIERDRGRWEVAPTVSKMMHC